MVLVLCSCGRQPQPAPRYEYEVIGVEQQALEAIEHMPTEFHVEFQDDEAVWDRGHLFFRTYTRAGSYEENFDYPSPGTTLRSKEGGDDLYTYEIERSQVSGGYRYLVHCSPRRQTALQCARNAKNIARFLRDGHLELSLLHR